MKNRLRRHRSVAEHPKHDVHSGTRYRRRRYRADTALRSKTADKAERQKGRYRSSRQSLTPSRRIPRISGCRQGSRRQKRSYPLSTAERIGSLNIFRSSFERYRIGFSARAAPSTPRANRRIRQPTITSEKAHKSTVGSRMTTARNDIA